MEEEIPSGTIIKKINCNKDFNKLIFVKKSQGNVFINGSKSLFLYLWLQNVSINGNVWQREMEQREAWSVDLKCLEMALQRTLWHNKTMPGDTLWTHHDLAPQIFVFCQNKE